MKEGDSSGESSARRRQLPLVANLNRVPACLLFLSCLAVAWPQPVVAAVPASPASDATFFESRIRPLLVEHCHSCHSAGAEKLKGGLHLDSIEGLLKGGDHGPALIPGDPEKSLLIRAVRHTDPDLQMPHKNRKLSDRQISDLTLWVKSGASWPEDDKVSTRSAKAAAGITAEDKRWWSFQPIRRPELPVFPPRTKIVSPIDALVRAALEARELRPNPPATRRELIRRAYFDLIGLPAPPEAIAAFEKDPAPDAWPRVIDDLLARPQYGERWARHWLDVVRFAQSNGYERDGEKPEAWRYRDYVVKAFNQDKPYDEFVREQLAGDELERVTPDSIVATGFQRLGVWDDEPDDKRMAEFDELDDILSTTGSAFLGLTIGCARCHEHKFDPIPQADYYRLLGFFRNLRLNENAKYTLDSPNYVPLAPASQVHEWQEAQASGLKALQARLESASDDAEKKKLRSELDAAKAGKPPFDFALAARERGATPPVTHVLARGNAGSPGVEVQPAFLSVLGDPSPVLPSAPPGATSSGRRRILADWIASPRNPLTARVAVNRIWQHHFGRGLVKTTSDFGRAGTPPTHPKLLDWLAAEFIENGWSIKKLHRTILLSQTYQMSSSARNARAIRADPGNDFFWRQNLRRLDAEALRDTLLAVSGRLNPTMGGRGFFPHLSGEVLAGQSRPGLDWEISTPDEQSRRSLYAYVRRTMPVPMLDAFDYSNTTSPLSERATTTVAPQSLHLLNDAFLNQQAAAFGGRLERECGGAGGVAARQALIRRGFLLAVGREPTSREGKLSDEFIQRQTRAFEGLRTRLTFRPDVPNSLSVSYMANLKPADFLTGPQSGWSYHRGKWAGAYEGIRTMERDRGPFALLAAPSFTNGLVEANVMLHTACESGGLLFRAVAKAGELQGYEVVMEPREQRVSLRRHAGQLVTLAQAAADIPTGRALSLRIAATDAQVRVWLGDSPRPVLEFTDAHPLLAAGSAGVRAWGAAVSVDALRVQPAGREALPVRDESAAPPAARALQAFCLMLLNLSEVVYVD